MTPTEAADSMRAAVKRLRAWARVMDQSPPQGPAEAALWSRNLDREADRLEHDAAELVPVLTKANGEAAE